MKIHQCYQKKRKWESVAKVVGSYHTFKIFWESWATNTGEREVWINMATPPPESLLELLRSEQNAKFGYWWVKNSIKIGFRKPSYSDEEKIGNRMERSMLMYEWLIMWAYASKLPLGFYLNYIRWANERKCIQFLQIITLIAIFIFLQPKLENFAGKYIIYREEGFFDVSSCWDMYAIIEVVLTLE